jgi:hypothetical protein
MTFTPGPWSRNSGVVVRSNKGVVCGVVLYDFPGLNPEVHIGPAEARANTDLIAQAPELHWFVQQIFNGLDTGMLKIDTPADETLATILTRGRVALARAGGAA